MTICLYEYSYLLQYNAYLFLLQENCPKIPLKSKCTKCQNNTYIYITKKNKYTQHLTVYLQILRSFKNIYSPKRVLPIIIRSKNVLVPKRPQNFLYVAIFGIFSLFFGGGGHFVQLKKKGETYHFIDKDKNPDRTLKISLSPNPLSCFSRPHFGGPN